MGLGLEFGESRPVSMFEIVVPSKFTELFFLLIFVDNTDAIDCLGRLL